MSGENSPMARAEGIAAAARAASGKRAHRPAFVNPSLCGDLDMRIARDGTWFYLGTPIGRFELVKLFSSILRKDGEKYFLVTPVEKVGITVDDALAVDFTVTGEGDDQVLTFETHVGDMVIASGEDPIRVKRDPETGNHALCAHSRGLEALIDRKSFYRMVDIDRSMRNGLAFGPMAFFQNYPSKRTRRRLVRLSPMRTLPCIHDVGHLCSVRDHRLFHHVLRCLN